MNLVDKNNNVIGGVLYEAVWSEMASSAWANKRNAMQKPLKKK